MGYGRISVMTYFLSLRGGDAHLYEKEEKKRTKTLDEKKTLRANDMARI
jgi:hypothetical protein